MVPAAAAAAQVNTGRVDVQGRTIWQGPRGGQYVMVNGKKRQPATRPARLRPVITVILADPRQQPVNTNSLTPGLYSASTGKPIRTSEDIKDTNSYIWVTMRDGQRRVLNNRGIMTKIIDGMTFVKTAMAQPEYTYTIGHMFYNVKNNSIVAEFTRRKKGTAVTKYLVMGARDMPKDLLSARPFGVIKIT